MRFSKEALLVALASGAFGVVGSAGAATVLTGAGTATNNDPIPAGHGSNEAGTPNILLDWTPNGDNGWETYTGWPNDPGNDVYQVDGTDVSVVFTPDAGFNAVVTSFDLNAWVGGGDQDVDWTLTGSASGLLGGGNTVTTDGTVATYNVGISGVGGETLTLNLIQNSGATSYLAMDNLAFDQVPVPEPGTAVLALGGLGAVMMRRKRK